MMLPFQPAQGLNRRLPIILQGIAVLNRGGDFIRALKKLPLTPQSFSQVTKTFCGFLELSTHCGPSFDSLCVCCALRLVLACSSARILKLLLHPSKIVGIGFLRLL